MWSTVGGTGCAQSRPLNRNAGDILQQEEEALMATVGKLDERSYDVCYEEKVLLLIS